MRASSNLHLLERSLLVIASVLLCFMPWALGTMHVWSQSITLGLASLTLGVALINRHYRGEFAPQDFQAFAGRNVLVLVDCEGAEDDILKPDLGPALAGMNLIVETHDVFRPGVKARLIERFSPTHDITVVDLGPKTMPLPAWLQEFAHLDQLLAVWEWRSAPTPWLGMRPKG